MSTKLIRLDDQTLVEVDGPPHEAFQVSSSAAEKVAATLGTIQPFLLQVCAPLRAAWRELSRDTDVAGAAVELSFGFEAEGQLFLAKTKGSGNVKVTISFQSVRKNER
jgi:hypothetical protein